VGAAGYLVVLQRQLQLGYSATAAGAALIPETVVFLIVSPLVGGLVARIGTRWPMAVGILLVVGGFAWLSVTQPGSSYVQTILPGALLWGFGIGLAVTPLTAGVLAAVDDSDLGEASSINDAASRIGGVVVIALVPVLLGAGQSASLAAPLAANYQTAMLVMAGLTVAAALITAVFVPSGRAVGRQRVVDPRVHGCAVPAAATKTRNVNVDRCFFATFITPISCNICVAAARGGCTGKPGPVVIVQHDRFDAGRVGHGLPPDDQPA